MPLETESRAQIRALISEFRPNHGDLLATLERAFELSHQQRLRLRR